MLLILKRIGDFQVKRHLDIYCSLMVFFYQLLNKLKRQLT